jgi:hypothetical protein
MANELRTALDEFILLARHDKENPRIFRDIELSEDDITSYENRPVRLLISTITR